MYWGYIGIMKRKWKLLYYSRVYIGVSTTISLSCFAERCAGAFLEMGEKAWSRVKTMAARDAYRSHRIIPYIYPEQLLEFTKGYGFWARTSTRREEL